MSHQKRLEAVHGQPVTRTNVLKHGAIPYGPHGLVVVGQREKDVAAGWVKMCLVRSGDGKDAVHEKRVCVPLLGNGVLPNIHDVVLEGQGICRHGTELVHQLAVAAP